MSIDEHIENLFDEPDKVLDGEKKKITLDDLNSLNIIINDSDCSNSFMNAICEDLIEKGLKFQYSNNENNFTTDHAVIISLDQQYISGPKMVVLAPYKNRKDDKSDQLALAANAAFQNAGIESGGICCGKKGFRKTGHNSIATRIPSATEDAIKDNETSFVDVCFGTKTPTFEQVSQGIIGTLMRFCAYSEKKDNNNDFIYRTESNDTIDVVAQKLNTTLNQLSSANVLPDVLTADVAIINPVSTTFDCFNKDVNYHLSSNEKASSFKH